MKKAYEIPIKSRIALFQAYLVAFNWTLGKNELTISEIEILSYFLYYNEKYKSIKEDEVRYELLFSTSVKKKIREEFNIDSQKLETYLNKLRKKGVVTSNNGINPAFVIYPENVIDLTFSFKMLNSKVKETPVVQAEKQEVITSQVEEMEDDLEEEFIEEETTTQKEISNPPDEPSLDPNAYNIVVEDTEGSAPVTSLWDKYMSNNNKGEDPRKNPMIV